MFQGPLHESISLRRAQDKGLVSIAVHDLRTWTQDRHRVVDDVPYGGGAGMVLKPEPVFEAVEALRRGPESTVAALTPHWQQDGARGRELLKRLPEKPNQFGHHALLLTRAILELATGPSSAADDPSPVGPERTGRACPPRSVRRRNRDPDWPAERRLGPRTGRLLGRVREGAIRIADDLIECFADIKVLFPWSGNGCKLVYIVRAEAAMFWFVNCSGGFPFSG